MSPAATIPASRTRRTSTGDLLELVSLDRVGTAGWGWAIRRTTPEGEVEETTRRTNDAGRGLWEGDRQITGTSEYSLPTGRADAIRQLLRAR